MNESSHPRSGSPHLNTLADLAPTSAYSSASSMPLPPFDPVSQNTLNDLSPSLETPSIILNPLPGLKQDPPIIQNESIPNQLSLPVDPNFNTNRLVQSNSGSNLNHSSSPANLSGSNNLDQSIPRESVAIRPRLISESVISTTESPFYPYDDGCIELEPPPEYVPRPPDGGWGWMIVLASFFCNMVVDGICYTVGVLYQDLAKSFPEVSISKMAWIGSLLSGMYLCVGPIVSALTNRFGCRPVTMVGGFMASICFLVAMFAPNIEMLIMTYGVLGGVSFGLIYLPAIVSVGHYFESKRAFATGIAVCGSGVGTFIFGPLTQVLLAKYGWRGSLAIFSGIILNTVAMGALMRPLPLPKPPKTKPLLQRIKEDKDARMRVRSDPRLYRISEDSFPEEEEYDEDVDVHTGDEEREGLLETKDERTRSHPEPGGDYPLAAFDKKDGFKPEKGPENEEKEDERIKRANMGSQLPDLAPIMEGLPLATPLQPMDIGGSRIKEIIGKDIMNADKRSASVSNLMSRSRLRIPYSALMLASSEESDFNNQEPEDEGSGKEENKSNRDSIRKIFSTPRSTDRNRGASSPSVMPLAASKCINGSLLRIRYNSLSSHVSLPGSVKGRPSKPQMQTDTSDSDKPKTKHSSISLSSSNTNHSSSLRDPKSLSPCKDAGSISKEPSEHSSPGRGDRTLVDKDLEVTKEGGDLSKIRMDEYDHDPEHDDWEEYENREDEYDDQGDEQMELELTSPLPEMEDFSRPLYRKDIFYHGSVTNLPEYRSQPDPRSYYTSMTSIPVQVTSTTDGYLPSGAPRRKKGAFRHFITHKLCPCLGKRCSDTLGEMTDLTLFRQPVFLLVCLSNVLAFAGFYVPFVYSVGLAQQFGIAESKTSLFVSIIGGSNIIGRLLFGYLTDSPRIDSLLVNNVCMTLAGICTILCPLCTGFASLAVVLFVFGLAGAAFISLTSIILVDLLGIERLTNAFGLLILFRGITSILGPPLAGWIHDKTGKYDGSFYVSGIFLTLAGITSFFLRPVQNRYLAKHAARLEKEALLEPPPYYRSSVYQNGKLPSGARRSNLSLSVPCNNIYRSGSSFSVAVRPSRISIVPNAAGPRKRRNLMNFKHKKASQQAANESAAMV